MTKDKTIELVKSPRFIMSLVTLAVIAVIIFLSREELVRAWELLGQANIWLLLLLIPFQIIVYFAGGEMIFSYLRKKKLIDHISKFEQTRIALELNLVNHIFPSGGLSGASYTTWRIGKLGVSSAKSTFAQVIRYAMGFLSIVALLIVAVLVIAIDGEINRYIVAGSFVLVILVLMVIFLLIIMFSSEKNMQQAATRISRTINKVVKWLTFGKVKELIKKERAIKFFDEMYDDAKELFRDKKLLIGPFFWGLVYAFFDVAMYVVAFLALGSFVNPAILVVGYGIAGLASIVSITPGGAGVYELVMIFFLSMAGVPSDLAIAGIVLTRVLLLFGTIVFGYIFYQQTLIKYGKRTDSPVQR
ncbi:flippase-like domain-containing protein [Candidatus Saccharibacteria bacterium]|nr:flippase-like domain-containing protein [Candidatus Saccharibacteria bacterium]